MSTDEERRQATSRVNTAIDKSEAPADADLMVCGIEALRRAQLRERERFPLVAAAVDAALPRRRVP